MPAATGATTMQAAAATGDSPTTQQPEILDERAPHTLTQFTQASTAVSHVGQRGTHSAWQGARPRPRRLRRVPGSCSDSMDLIRVQLKFY